MRLRDFFLLSRIEPLFNIQKNNCSPIFSGPYLSSDFIVVLVHRRHTRSLIPSSGPRNQLVFSSICEERSHVSARLVVFSFARVSFDLVTFVVENGFCLAGDRLQLFLRALFVQIVISSPGATDDKLFADQLVQNGRSCECVNEGRLPGACVAKK